MMCIVPHLALDFRQYTLIIVPLGETIKPLFANCEKAASTLGESERGLTMLTSCVGNHFFGIRIA